MGITVRGLHQGYRGQRVLRGLDLDLSPGVFGLLGPNGAGKTTLLRTLATETRPQEGSLLLLGLDPSDPKQLREVRRRMGFLPQRFGYFPGFTVREFIEYCAWLREVPKPEIPARVSRAISAVDLGGVTKRKLKSLSDGTLRRAGIACAIVNEPELLILDEPTAGLDPEQRATFRKLLRTYGTGGVVIVATHLVEDVAMACTDVAVMYKGRVVSLPPLERRMWRSSVRMSASGQETGTQPASRCSLATYFSLRSSQPWLPGRPGGRGAAGTRRSPRPCPGRRSGRR